MKRFKNIKYLRLSNEQEFHLNLIPMYIIFHINLLVMQVNTANPLILVPHLNLHKVIIKLILSITINNYILFDFYFLIFILYQVSP
jgi:hypothetical protein